MLCDLEVVDDLAVFIDRVSDDSISLAVSDSISSQSQANMLTLRGKHGS